MNKVRIAGAIASPAGITLYLEDGKELNFLKNSPSAKAILDETVDALARKQVVELDLDNYSVERRIERKTGGLIRFMKTTVSRLATLAGGSFVEKDQSELIGTLQRYHSGGVVGKSDIPAVLTRPVGASPLTGNLVVKSEPDPEVSVAIVNTPSGPVVVPGVEALAAQMEHAAYEDVTGFQNFMTRIATVIGERGHTVQELLNFMKRGDLPIADDGSIVAYKVLETFRAPPGKFVDCHSGNVAQRLGSRVCMPVDLVNPSKRMECSTGLHIARRGYLSKFSGDVITLVKVAPEDVVAVPNNEPDKMRAAAYHIVAVLPSEVHSTLRAGRPMTGDSDASRMLADVIAGKHVGILEHVEIRGPSGTDIVITPADGVALDIGETTGKFAHALDDENRVVNFGEIRKRADAAIAEQKVEPKLELAKALDVAAKTASSPADVVSKAVAKKAEKPDPVPEKRVKPATGKDSTKKTPAPVQSYIVTADKASPNTAITRTSEYDVKIGEAQRLKDGGWSLREIEKHLGMCRKSLGKKLK